MSKAGVSWFVRGAVFASTAWLMACGSSTAPTPSDGSVADRRDPPGDGAIGFDVVSPPIDAIEPPMDGGPASFCARALCGPGTTCCEASMSCLPDGTPCPPTGGMDAGPGPMMCGSAICGADQRCCATPVGPTCLPTTVPCNPVSDGGTGGTCGGMTCGPTQECCSGLGRMACVPRGTCPMMVDAGTCGGMVCTAAQECCSAGGRQFCAPRGTCSPPPTDAGPTCGGMVCTGTQICCSGFGFMTCLEPRLCPTGTDGGTGPRCGAMTCSSDQECCNTMFGMFCAPRGRCPGGGGDSGVVTDSGTTSFCATVRCAAGSFCCEARRACIPNSETCRSTPLPMCMPACMRGQQCCPGFGGLSGVCLPRCPTDPCMGVTCGSGYTCCGTGMNSGRCTADACLACCM